VLRRQLATASSGGSGSDSTAGQPAANPPNAPAISQPGKWLSPRTLILELLAELRRGGPAGVLLILAGTHHFRFQDDDTLPKPYIAQQAISVFGNPLVDV